MAPPDTAETRGGIKIEPPSVKTKKEAIRLAPSFIAGMIGANADHPYTAESLNDFLAIWRERISGALLALELIARMCR